MGPSYIHFSYIFKWFFVGSFPKIYFNLFIEVILGVLMFFCLPFLPFLPGSKKSLETSKLHDFLELDELWPSLSESKLLDFWESLLCELFLDYFWPDFSSFSFSVTFFSSFSSRDEDIGSEKFDFLGGASLNERSLDKTLSIFYWPFSRTPSFACFCRVSMRAEAPNANGVPC